jgi:hypothetical protein
MVPRLLAVASINRAASFIGSVSWKTTVDNAR